MESLQAECDRCSAEKAAAEEQVARIQGLDAAQLVAETRRLRSDHERLRERMAQEEAARTAGAARHEELLVEKAERASEQLSTQLDEARRQRDAVLHEAELAEQRLLQAQQGIVLTDETAMLQEVGIYEYRHQLDDAIAYKAELQELKDRLKTMVRHGQAVLSATDWQVDGSAAKGRKLVRDFSKLLLRAYNAEADYAVRNMRPYRLHSQVDRLEKSRETIARLGGTMRIQISEAYHRLRVRELELTADYLAKQEEEKEYRREMRAQQREEETLQREIERERARLEKERDHYLSALQRLRASTGAADPASVSHLETKLAEVDVAIEAVDYREANIRAGYVYVISNIGSFGEHMVKIGMTRRLEPMDRIRELGDASVPFRFDVHALIFSEDAVGLERRLHQEFEDRRVNRINLRREFFYVTPAEVRTAMERFAGAHLLEFHEETDAPEWRASGAA
ncbi:DUF4041 domain-containing protein [Streptomyces halobius]|uniref:DUF4041 domain-containing protein n=1 Tax=Streptomyces halobius TaxID=2879846 RepID=A0ABY4MDU2_9ACTN|nr:DUF4041 domain-containing protein [Streptomyces halobius]UQA95892.1 DUF4041 domain-containing protein [Streptomyces halobius]